MSMNKGTKLEIHYDGGIINMQVEFKTDANIVLLAYFLGGKRKYSQIIEKVKLPPKFEEFWNDEQYWQELRTAVLNNSLDDFFGSNPKHNNVFKYFQNLSTFQKKLDLAQKHRDEIAIFWNEHKDVSKAFYQNVLKLDLSQVENMTVYVATPATCIGRYFGNNKIFWGHVKGVDDPWYNFIYIHHEILHSVLPLIGEDLEDDLNHAIIELASDYELWSNVSADPKINIGHQRLLDIRKEIYYDWLSYLGLNEEQIQKRIIKDGMEEISFEELPKLSDKNIFEFRDYILKNYNSLERVNSRS